MGSSGIHNVKIAGATLVDVRALVGLNLSPSDVPHVKQRLGIGTPLGEASRRRFSVCWPAVPLSSWTTAGSS